MELPDENIHTFFSTIRQKSKVPILVISMHKKIVEIIDCIQLGVNGYILKNDEDYLILAIQELLTGKEFYPPEIRKLLNSSETQNLLLSEREKEVLKLIALGYSNIEIANELILSKETIKTHKRNIKIKLDLKTNREIVEFCKINFII